MEEPFSGDDRPYGPVSDVNSMADWTNAADQDGLIYRFFYMLSANESANLFNDTSKEEILKQLVKWASSQCTKRNDTQENCTYCSDGPLKELASGYRSMHGYVSLAICLFGVISNLLNVAVLTRKDMASAPINRILTGLAVADMLVTLEYVPFACYMYVALPARLDYTYRWAAYLLFHVHFTQVLHTISICITLTLAVWRYIAVRFPERNRSLCTHQRCHVAIAVSYTLPVVVCVPNYVAYHINESCIWEEHPLHFTKVYHVGPSNKLLHTVNFWVYSVVIKLLPCFILTVIICWLIKALYKVNKRHQALKAYGKCNGEASVALATSSASGGGGSAGGGGGGGWSDGAGAASGGASGTGATRPGNRSERRTDRTTRMLVAILVLFLVTEFPQGILGLLSGFLGGCFFLRCYHTFGELMDALALLNGAINFILYCSMSRQFRTTFGQLFKPRMLSKWGTPSQATMEVQSTYV